MISTAVSLGEVRPIISRHQFLLLDLPVEIRNRVYELLLCSSGVKVVVRDFDFMLGSKSVMLQPNMSNYQMLRVCRNHARDVLICQDHPSPTVERQSFVSLDPVAL